MKTIKVKSLMIPLSEYATVSEDATLFDAIIALEEVQKVFDKDRYRHRAVLVYDENNKIVGKVSQMDILRALEPKYAHMGNTVSLSRFGLSREFQQAISEQFRLLDKPMNDICRKAGKVKVKNFMYTPTEGEYVDENTSFNDAIHQIIMGHHQALLVTRDDEIVGVLRLADVYNEICQSIKACEL